MLGSARARRRRLRRDLRGCRAVHQRRRAPGASAARGVLARAARLSQMKLRRGLKDPVLVVTDGAAGLIAAAEICWAGSLRQRCLAHKMRNLLAKLPEEIRAEFRQAAKASYQAPSPALAQVLREDWSSATASSTRARCAASRRTSRPASPTCTAHLAIGAASAPPTSWSGSSARSADG